MEALYCRAICDGLNSSRLFVVRRNFNVLRYDRSITTTPILSAAKKSKKPSRKPVHASQKPSAQEPPKKTTPEYKPSSKKPPPDLRATLKRSSESRESRRTNRFRNHPVAIAIGSVAILSLSGYLAYIYVILSRPASGPIVTSAAEQADVAGRYDDIARDFDTTVDWTETAMRISKRRRELAERAEGHVLEVSVGTGRNLEWLDFAFGKDIKAKVKSYTAVDKSGEMLEVAHEKFSKLYPGKIGARWVVGDASEEGVIPAAPRSADERSGNKEVRKYDTVVQTMGLCSVDDPVKLLQNLGKVVKEEDGRILLLEHGRANWGWLNNILDKSAEGHAHRFGCWWNRDLGQIVEESGLQVVEVKRFQGGTTWWFELKKPRSEPVEEAVKTGQASEKKKWWW